MRSSPRGERIKSVPLFLKTEIVRSEKAVALTEGDPRFEGLGIRWNSRLRGTAGHIKFNRATRLPIVIELNPKLKANPEELRTTALHEIGHALTLFMGVDDGHGPMWEIACRELGLSEPTRYHQHTSLPKRRTKVVGKCVACGREYRRTNYLRRGHRYTCGCGETLVSDPALLAEVL